MFTRRGPRRRRPPPGATRDAVRGAMRGATRGVLRGVLRGSAGCALGWLILFNACGVARGAFTALWAQNTITPAAVADDPALAGMQSWSLMVTYTKGNWASAGVRATLPAGNVFYHHPMGGDVAPHPAVVAQFPALEFDTYVTDPTRLNTLLLRGHPTSDPASFGGPGDVVPGRFSVSWGNLIVDPPATYEIARLTFPLGVFPHVSDGSGGLPQSETYTVNPDVTAAVGQIPEPATVASLAGLLALAAPRRASSVARHASRGRGAVEAI